MAHFVVAHLADEGLPLLGKPDRPVEVGYTTKSMAPICKEVLFRDGAPRS
jgi:hypothetical protein